eukprot:jgi/Bigna1/133495/aug1.21_g8203
MQTSESTLRTSDEQSPQGRTSSVPPSSASTTEIAKSEGQIRCSQLEPPIDPEGDVKIKTPSTTPATRSRNRSKTFTLLAKKEELRGKQEGSFEVFTAEYDAISLLEFVTRLKDNLDIQDRKGILKKHKECFIGKEAVAWLVKSNLSRDREHAVKMVQRLSNIGVIANTSNKRRQFCDDNSYYRFNDVAVEALALSSV